MGNKNSIYNIDLKDSFLSDAINTHNKHRADHKCPPLQHADDLSELAHKIAYYTSTRNKDLKNRLSKDRIENTHGENTALKILTTNQNYSGEDVTNNWYDEMENYEKYFNREPPPEVKYPDVKYFKNFTQLIWKDTKEVGFRKINSNNRVIVVACYRPAGNIPGQYTQNVLPPAREECCSCC